MYYLLQAKCLCLPTPQIHVETLILIVAIFQDVVSKEVIKVQWEWGPDPIGLMSL